MADIPLKSFTFPGLSDKYTTPVVDNTLAVAGAAADAKKTGDEIGAIKNDLSEFPNGNYPQMGAGYANQLVSGLKKADQTPYNFRRIPYDATLEEVEKIVGGTIVNNQLVDKSKLTSGSSGNHTVTPHDDGSITLVVSGDTSTVVAINLTANSLPSYLKVPNGHKFAVLDSNPQPNGVSYRNNYNGVSIGYNTISDKTSSSGYIFLAVRLTNATEGTYTLKPQIIDLTQDFGTAIADYVYNLETATAGAGVAWLKTHFPKQFNSGYQAYDAGTLKSIEGLSAKKTVGFNQWDEEWELGQYNTNNGTKAGDSGQIRSKNYIPISPSTAYYVNTSSNTNAYFKPLFYDANKSYIGTTNSFRNGSFTSPSNAHYMTFYMNENYGTTYNHDICINLSDPTKNGTYEPYEAHSYALDSDVVLRGIPKLDSNNQLYYDGDEYLPDGTVIRNLKVYTTAESNILYAPNNSGYANIAYARITKPNDAKAFNSASYFPLLVEDYPLSDATSNWDVAEKVGYAFYGADTATWWIGFPHGTTLEQMKTALVGKTVLYAATPTTETADPYQATQIISPDGTEEYIYVDGSFELPVGHSSDYPVNVSGQLDDIMDTPSANGTYVLKATVTDGAVAYSWVADA